MMPKKQSREKQRNPFCSSARCIITMILAVRKNEIKEEKVMLQMEKSHVPSLFISIIHWIEEEMIWRGHKEEIVWQQPKGIDSTEVLKMMPWPSYLVVITHYIKIVSAMSLPLWN